MPEHTTTPETRRELDEMLRHARALRDQARLELVRKRSAASRLHRAPPPTHSSNAVIRTVLLTLAMAVLPATVALVVPGETDGNRVQQLGRYIDTALPWRQPSAEMAGTRDVPVPAGADELATDVTPSPATSAVADDPDAALARRAARVREAAELRFAQRLAEWEALRAQ